MVNVVFCATCGRRTTDEGDYCSQCGAPLSTDDLVARGEAPEDLSATHGRARRYLPWVIATLGVAMVVVVTGYWITNRLDRAEENERQQRAEAMQALDARTWATLDSLVQHGSMEDFDTFFERAVHERGGELKDSWYKTAAHRLAREGRYEIADRILQKYFVQDPVEVEPDLWIELAEMAISTGDSSQAITFLSRAIRVDPNNQRAFLRHINLAHDMGNEEMAKTFIYQWVRTHPNDTLTARLYEQYLETDRFPEELEWENVVGSSDARSIDRNP